MRGVVKWFDYGKGYGFLRPDSGGRDVFVHITAVERADLGPLKEGQALEFQIITARGRPAAEDLKAVGNER